jgi:protein-disulfide isomerase
MTNAKPLILIVLAILAAGGVAVFLSGGDSDPEAPAAGGGRIRGNPDAPVTLTEFGDYQCPSCAYYHPIVMELLQRYPAQVKLLFHHYPLVQIHGNAMAAAIAAEAAGDQGKFWEMHDRLFEDQMVWATDPKAEEYFVNVASHLGLDTAKFRESFQSPATQARVLADVRKGVDAKVGGTPTFYINGQTVPASAGLEELARLIDGHLKTAAR